MSEFEDGVSRSRVEALVKELVSLSQSIEACEALGVNGVLSEQVDVSFLEDPIDYIAYDLATALHASEEEDGVSAEVPPLLATLVAEVKLCRALRGKLDEIELVSRTMENLQE